MSSIQSFCSVPFTPVDVREDGEARWVGTGKWGRGEPTEQEDSILQNYCCLPRLQFHYVKNQARFFVQDVDTASALKDVSYKICDEENRKVCVEGITST